MTKPTKVCDGFIVDTYKSVDHHCYVPGAITMLKRKNVEALHWDESFKTEEESNEFVRAELEKMGLPERQQY